MNPPPPPLKIQHTMESMENASTSAETEQNNAATTEDQMEYDAGCPFILESSTITEVWILQGIYPLKDEWVFGCSLITRLADQTKTQQLKWLWSKDSMNSTINQRLVEQTQEMNFKLEGSGGSTLDDTLRKQYLSSSDE